jgi:type IV pilus assembly protein PilN
MIRINLLGVSKPRKRAGVAVPAAMRAPNVAMIAAVLAVVTVGGNYAWYWTLNHESSQLRVQMQREDEKNRRLADVKAKYTELEKQKNQYEHRVNVINELAKQKQGPVDLLTTIADTVNRTDAVWLNTMKENGTAIDLEGVALSVNAVATLMQNLRNTGQFRSVEIKETFQDDVVKNVQAFVFTLTCERQQAQETQPAQPAQQTKKS